LAFAGILSAPVVGCALASSRLKIRFMVLSILS
jgi:hypothetical protein